MGRKYRAAKVATVSRTGTREQARLFAVEEEAQAERGFRGSMLDKAFQ